MKHYKRQTLFMHTAFNTHPELPQGQPTGMSPKIRPHPGGGGDGGGRGGGGRGGGGGGDGGGEGGGGGGDGGGGFGEGGGGEGGGGGNGGGGGGDGGEGSGGGDERGGGGSKEAGGGSVAGGGGSREGRMHTLLRHSAPSTHPEVPQGQPRGMSPRTRAHPGGGGDDLGGSPGARGFRDEGGGIDSDVLSAFGGDM